MSFYSIIFCFILYHVTLYCVLVCYVTFHCIRLYFRRILRILGSASRSRLSFSSSLIAQKTLRLGSATCSSSPLLRKFVGPQYGCFYTWGALFGRLFMISACYFGSMLGPLISENSHIPTAVLCGHPRFSSKKLFRCSWPSSCRTSSRVLRISTSTMPQTQFGIGS